MQINFTLHCTLLCALLLSFQLSTKGQSCATAQRLITPSFTTTSNSTVAANSYSSNGWVGSSNSTGNLYLSSNGIEFSDNSVYL